MTSTTLTREKLLAAKPQEFTVDWDGNEIKARALSQVQMSEFNAWQLNADCSPNKERLARRNQRLVAMCLLNDDGSLMFPGSDWELVEQIDAGVINDLFNQVAAGCGLAAIEEQPDQVGN